MDKHISIGGVKLPLNDYAVARTGILGITRSGKTYAAKGIAEQLLDAGVPIVVFDAIGVWRFIKTPGAGKSARGYPVVVAGGATPDLPLTPESAPEIVRAAIRENIPLIVDLYDPKLSKADWRKIVQRCFRVLLYENKGLRHVFLEETPEYAPQRVLDGETYAEVEKLARMGGNASLGITLIAQRSQEINKAVLELCDNLVLMRQRGSNAIAHLEKWLDRVSPDVAREISKSLPQMTQGDCWVWAEEAENPVRTRTAELHSLHPDRRNPAQAATAGKPADTHEFVARLGTQLTTLIERAKEDDPRELKKQIAELRRQLKANAPDPAAIERAVAQAVSERDREWQQRAAEMTREAGRLSSVLTKIAALVGETDGDRMIEVPALPALRRQPPKEARPAPVVPIRPVAPAANGGGNGSVGKSGLRRMLIALAQRPQGLSARQLGVRAKLSSGSGTFDTYLSRARQSGWIEGTKAHMTITDAGRDALGDFEPLPEGRELLNHWLAELGSSGAARILSVLADEYPRALNKTDLAERAGLTAGSGTFDTYLSRLRSLELIEGRGELKAADEFFT